MVGFFDVRVQSFCMKVFIIPGYGIPESIEQDQNYLTYLHVAFNRIYEAAKGEKALIIPCGGPTNCTPPYEGTEAAMIGAYIQKLIDRPMMGDLCKAWSIQLENRSLSTLENLIFVKDILDRTEGVELVVIFCEATRADRIRVVSNQILSTRRNVTIEAIDFDITANRYSKTVVGVKEQRATDGFLWALESPERLAKYHELYERRLTLIRTLQNEGLSHVDAVAEWYRQAPALIAELMPNHPGLK